MIFFNLSWTLQNTGGHSKNFDWKDIKEKLELVLESSGTVTIDAEDENDLSRSLQVRADKGTFFVSLGVETSDDWVVRTFSIDKNSSEIVDILGDMWGGKTVSYDKVEIMRVFYEFYSTGDISQDLLK